MSLIYGTVIFIRNKLYDWGVYKSQKLDIPVICVGNITVGGTGKTPHIEYLIRTLSKEYTVAVLSRGYGRKSKGFQYVETSDTIEKTGDEPLQIKRKFPEIIVAVSVDRVGGIKKLQQDYPTIDVVLLDDAFQHRKITASLNIILIDYNRPVWRDLLLPAGMLRDCRCSLKRADIFVITKCPDELTEKQKNNFIKHLEKYKKEIYFSRNVLGGELNVFGINKPFESSKIFAFAGIAKPGQFFKQLEKRYKGAQIKTMSYPDHYQFGLKDMETILTKMQTSAVITTEKDSVRLISYFCNSEQKPDNIFYIPMIVEIDKPEKLNNTIIKHVRQN